MLRTLKFYRLSVVKSILLFTSINFVRTFCCLLDVEVNLYSPSLDIFAVHFQKRILRRLVRLELDVGKSFRLLSLPVCRQSDGFDFSKSPEPISNIVFFKRVRQAFDKKGTTVVWHLLSYFNYSLS